MRTIMGRVVTLGLLAAVVGGCSAGGAYVVSVGDKTTLTYGWETRFGIEWTVEPDTPETRVVRGRVVSRSPVAAERMRLLVQASDAAGRPITQRILWLPTGVPGGSGAYFEVKGMPVAEQYRVTVWDYSVIETGDFL